MYTICLSVLILIVAGNEFAAAGITSEQMEKSFETVRNVCQPKTKVTDEQLADMRKGIWNGQEIKCYTHCVMELMGVLKRTKVNAEAALKQFKVLLPEHMREPYAHGMNTCKDKGAGVKDTCEVGYLLTKCMQETVDVFMFP